MKRLLIYFFLIPFIVSAQTKNLTSLDKVKAGVKKYLYLNMKDYKSYQGVQWGKLEVIQSDYLSTQRCAALLDSIDAIKGPYTKEYDAFHERGQLEGIDLNKDSLYQSYIKLLSPIQAKVTPILNVINKERAAFKKVIIGYSIYHKYRGKNSYGAYTLAGETFTLDKKFEVESTQSDEND